MKKTLISFILALACTAAFSLPNNAINSPSLSNIAVANNSTIVTNGSGVGSLSQTLPAAVQANITIAESQVTNLVSDLALKAPLASPTFTGVANASGTFRTGNTILFTAAIASYNATSGSTISAADFAGGVISVNPAAPQAITTCTASDLDSQLVSMFGSIPVGSAFHLTYFNQSANPSVITAGSGMTFTRGGSSTTVSALFTADFTVIKNTSAPAYLIVGN